LSNVFWILFSQFCSDLVKSFDSKHNEHEWQSRRVADDDQSASSSRKQYIRFERANDDSNEQSEQENKLNKILFFCMFESRFF
jgi:hypothetical protein